MCKYYLPMLGVLARMDSEVAVRVTAYSGGTLRVEKQGPSGLGFSGSQNSTSAVTPPPLLRISLSMACHPVKPSTIRAFAPSIPFKHIKD
jgi:hypothetical protein